MSTNGQGTSSVFNPSSQLTFICSLIPSFSGDRLEYNNFISGCDNAYAFADESLHRALLFFIISKIDASVKSRFAGRTFETWESLKEILNVFYQDRKHYVQLMEELNSLKQNHKESILAYYTKIDTLQSRMLLTLGSGEESKGKVELIQELALNRFIYHCNPEISRFLRCQSLRNLADALSKAMEEEKALKMTSTTEKYNIFCDFCKIKGHETDSCRKLQRFNQNINLNVAQPSNSGFNSNFQPRNNFYNQGYPSNVHFIPQNQQVSQQNLNSYPNSNFNSNKTPNNNQSFPKFCTYCKKEGHIITKCHKREYNNKKNGFQPRNNSSVHTLSAGALNSNNPSVSVNQRGHQ